MIRVFTQDDWQPFLGAERFSDGDPLIAEQAGLLYIADATGITTIDEDGEEDFVIRFRERDNVTQAMARKVLFGILNG